jgi:hypothetical protein
MTTKDDVAKIQALFAEGATPAEINLAARALEQKHAPRCPDCGEAMTTGKCVVREGARIFICLPCTDCPCDHCTKIREARNQH